MIRIAKISQEILLTLGAILGVICILAALAAVFFGVTPLIFRSGSMSPEIHTGALALAQEVPASEIRVADVISAINPQGTRVTHRVIAVSPHADGTVALTMLGDANEVANPEPYVVTKADRVIWHLDGLGFVVQEIQKPPYVFAMGLLAGALLVFSVRSRRAARRAAGHTLDTMALFTDQAGAVSASLSSSLPVAFRPTAVTCAGTGSGVGRDLTIAWTAPITTPNDTKVTARPLAPTTVSPGGTTSITYTAATIAATQATSFTIVVAARHFTNWTAPAATYLATINPSNSKVTCNLA